MQSIIVPYHPCATVEEAMDVLSLLVDRQNGGDASYFHGQRNRYQYSVGRILRLRPPPCRVLDIGSHYLHQSVLLSLLGYEVCGLDIPLFTGPEFIRARADAMKVRNISSSGHQAGEFLAGYDDGFDLVICTEFLEHIAFNPVAFWHRIWQVLAPTGMIYLTTPNVYRARALAATLVRLLSFQGVGLSVDDVLGVITYGHHWKEYSCREIRRYFQRLSPDFHVSTQTYGHDEQQERLARKLLEVLPPFRSNIEAIVRLSRKTAFASPPHLPMQAQPAAASPAGADHAAHAFA